MNIATSQQLPIFVINLPEAVKRKEFMRKQLETNNLKYEIFNGLKFDEIPKEVISKLNANNMKYMGDIGCTISHYLLLKKIVHENIPMAMVFEDDALISKDLTTIIKNYHQLPQCWDILRFGYWHKLRFVQLAKWQVYPLSYLHRQRIDFDKFSIWIGAFCDFIEGAHAYIITQDGAKRIINLMESHGESYRLRAFDYFLYDHRGSLRSYGTTPCMSNQANEINYGLERQTTLEREQRREMISAEQLSEDIKLNRKKHPITEALLNRLRKNTIILQRAYHLLISLWKSLSLIKLILKKPVMRRD